MVKIAYWITLVLILGDFILGGFLFALTGDYWERLPFPLQLIEGAGFTYGFSLILLFPYIAVILFLFKNKSKLTPGYIKILIYLAFLSGALYVGGFIHSQINVQKYKSNNKSYALKQANMQTKLNVEEPEIIQNINVTKVPQNYKTYEIKFDLIIPKAYIEDSNGSFHLKVNSDDNLYSIDEYFRYSQGQIVSSNTIKPEGLMSYISPSFDPNGNLNIKVTYIINEINNPTPDKHTFDVFFTLDPEQPRTTTPPVYKLEYSKTITL